MISRAGHDVRGAPAASLALLALMACADPTPPPGLALGDATSWPATEPATATVRIHYPNGRVPIAVRSEGIDEVPCRPEREEGVCTASITELPIGEKTLAFRPYLGEQPARGARYLVERGETIDIYPHFIATEGELRTLIPDFHSEILEAEEPGNQRIIYAYLPASYGENPLASYPVVYMHDGRNLFDAASSISGIEWEVDETVERAWEETGAIDEVIVIGIDQLVTIDGALQNRRRGEYNPTTTTITLPPIGDLYAEMVATELKPAIDALLRTRPGREHTATLGSSMGGWISSWIAYRYPELFGLCAALSTADQIGTEWLAQRIAVPAPGPRLQRIYLDGGTTEPGGGLAAVLFADVYRSLGYVDGADLMLFHELGGLHAEGDWARRLPVALAFLFPARRTP